ncbi:hypothetical protein D9M70_485660 [compost metagenome]
MSEAARLDADLRVAGTIAGEGLIGLAQALERFAEEPGIALVERLEAIDSSRRIVEVLRLERLRRCDGKDGV